MTLVSWPDFGTWAGIVALVLISNVAIWGFIHQSIVEIRARNEDQRFRVNNFENVTLRNYEQRVATLEQTSNQERAHVDSLEKANEALRLRVQHLEDNGHNPSTALWRLLVLSTSDSVSVLHSRVEWHLRWLEDLSTKGDLANRDELKANDVSLSRRLEPRLYEIDVCADSRRRRAAAHALANASGDAHSLKRLESVLADAKDLQPFVDSLAVRLAETSDIRAD